MKDKPWATYKRDFVANLEMAYIGIALWVHTRSTWRTGLTKPKLFSALLRLALIYASAFCHSSGS